MPGTLDDVREIIQFLEGHGTGPVTLLIVPGRKWEKSGISFLKELENDGYKLAGHGWTHQRLRTASFAHGVHSRLMSRDYAEHLSLEREEIMNIVRRSYGWFQKEGLKPPILYIPPAWAIGKISKNDLKELPFRFYETMMRIHDSDTGSSSKLPLVWFNADTSLRVFSSHVSNALNKAIGALSNQPVRIAVHPIDLRLGFASHLSLALDQCDAFVTYREVMTSANRSRTSSPCHP